ncbi:MAG: 30S ribosomal protein S8 [Planctomycetes bacterium]|nr:30S ribosomal protein S8 [Planctomycetota bacterium]
MSLSDPIADMLTRIRNAARVRHRHVNVMASKVCAGIAEVLKQEGYVEDFKFVDDGKQGVLRVYLKYGPNGEQTITDIQRTSTPGRRIYRSVANLPRPISGLGVAIVSTSKGVMSDRQARAANVGGEVLCTVL